MSRALNNPKYAKILEPYKDKRSVFIIDEAHRSNFGKMNADIRRHFRNADFRSFKVAGAIPTIYYKDYSKINFGLPTLNEQTK